MRKLPSYRCAHLGHFAHRRRAVEAGLQRILQRHRDNDIGVLTGVSSDGLNN